MMTSPGVRQRMRVIWVGTGTPQVLETHICTIPTSSFGECRVHFVTPAMRMRAGIKAVWFMGQ
jgi:hypothetical protein